MDSLLDLGPFALLCLTSLLAIVNPLSAAPIYLALTDGYTDQHRRATLRRALFTAALVLVAFILLGRVIFQVFGITLEAFRIAGGIILFGIGLDMLRAQRSRVKVTPEEEAEGMTREDVGVFPLGIPLIVGPGAITTAMVLVSRVESIGHLAVLFGAVAVVLGVMGLTLRLGPRVVGYLGQTGLNVITRIMGLLLTVIAAQFVIDGARPILTEILRSAAAG